MSPEQIGERLTALQTEVVAKIGRQPFLAPYLIVWASGRCQVMVYLGSHDDKESPVADTPDEALKAAEAIVAALPAAEDRDRHLFMQDLAKLIDAGRAKGIDLEYLNPLEATMKRLSSNAITHRKAEAQA